MFRYILTVAALLALTACTPPTIRSKVESFHVLPTGYLGETIAVSRSGIEPGGKLEFETYASKLEAKLAEVGFIVVAENRNPHYLAGLGYVIGEGKEVVGSYSIPQYGITGYSSSNTYGTLNSYGSYGTYSGTTTYTPQYGITGYDSIITSETVYPRAVEVSIFDLYESTAQELKEVYSVRIGSSGSCGSLSSVIDAMLQAGFQEFPGESGKARTVDVEFDGQC